MANLERIYTIPLGDAYLRVRNKRAKRAIAFVQAFALRHMKAEDVKISEGTNSLVFRDGMQKPPRRIKVRLVKGEDGIVKVWLIGEEERLKAVLDKKKAEENRKKEDEKRAEEAKKKEAQKKEEGAKDASQPAPKAAPGAQQAKPAPQAQPSTAKPSQAPQAKPQQDQGAKKAPVQPATPLQAKK